MSEVGKRLLQIRTRAHRCNRRYRVHLHQHLVDAQGGWVARGERIERASFVYFEVMCMELWEGLRGDWCQAQRKQIADPSNGTIRLETPMEVSNRLAARQLAKDIADQKRTRRHHVSKHFSLLSEQPTEKGL